MSTYTTCPVCRRGRLLPDGRALDNRPAYRCGNCGHHCTNGHAGFAWDTRHKNDSIDTESR